MGAGDIRAGRSFVEMFLKNEVSRELQKLEKELKDFGKKVADIGKSFLAIGASISAPLVLATQQFATMGDQVNKASQRTGIAVDKLSGLKYAIEQSGGSFEDFEGSIKKMEKALFEAEMGSKTARASLASIGLTIQQLKGLSPDQQFLKIADGLNKIKDPGAKAALAMEIFGKNGTTLLPMLEGGSQAIRDLTSRAEQLGLIINKTDAESATRFGDTIEDLWKQFRALAFQIGAAISNAIQPFADIAINVMSSVIKWVKEHRSLVLIVAASAAGFLVAGAALVTLGAGFIAVSAAISGIVAAAGMVATAIGLIFNPIVLVGAALAGVVGYLIYSTGVGQKVIEYLKAKFGELADTAGETFGGIADALAAGDITLAAQILWTGLKLAWAQGTFELHKKWIDFKFGFIELATEAFFGALNSWQAVKASLLTYFNNTVTALADIWDIFSTGFAKTWDSIINGVAKGLLYIQSLWDDTINYDEAAKAIDDQQASDNAQRDKDQNARFRERTNATKDENKQIESNKNKEIDKNKSVRDAVLEKSATENQSEKDQLTADKNSLSSQLDALRKKSAEEKKNKNDSGLSTPSFDPKKFSVDDIEGQRKSVLEGAKAGGLFNIRGLQALQGGPTVDYLRRTAAATEEIVRNTRNGTKFK